MKQTVKSAHLARRDAETRHVAVGHADSLDQSVQGSFGVLPNLIGRSPEDDHGVAVCVPQELVRSPHHPEHTGVSYDPQRGPIAHVGLITQSRGIIHTDHTLRTVDLFSCLTTKDVAGARHQSAVMAAQTHILGEKTQHENYITILKIPLLCKINRGVEIKSIITSSLIVYSFPKR